MKDSWIRINIALFYRGDNFADYDVKKETKKLYLPLDSILSMQEFISKRLTFNEISQFSSLSNEDKLYYYFDGTKEYSDLFKRIKTILKTKDALYYVIETCEELVHQDF